MSDKYCRPWSDAVHDSRRLIRSYDIWSAIRYLFADDVISMCASIYLLKNNICGIDGKMYRVCYTIKYNIYVWNHTVAGDLRWLGIARYRRICEVRKYISVASQNNIGSKWTCCITEGFISDQKLHQVFYTANVMMLRMRTRKRTWYAWFTLYSYKTVTWNDVIP